MSMIARFLERKLIALTNRSFMHRLSRISCGYFFIALGLGFLTAIGCDDGRPARVPIAGRVLIDGKPLAVGNVQFVPEGARPSYGKLDKQGRFELTCYDGKDGAVRGRHRVQVSGSEIVNQSQVWHAPIKYANVDTSGMIFEVTEAADSLVIELNSDGRPATIRTDVVAN
jgi:hypothetical protein